MRRRRRRGPFTALPDGGVAVDLDPSYRALLAALPQQLAELLEVQPDDPGLRRLRPPAHVGDAEAEAEYQRFVGDELATRRREHLALLAGSADAEVLDAPTAEAWLLAMNALRLYLGTSLDVSEETEPEDFDDEHDRARYVVLAVLGQLQDGLVAALDEALPAPTQG